MPDPIEIPALRVGEIEYSLVELLRFLRARDWSHWLDEFADTLIVRGAAKESGIEISDAALQQAADEFRRSRGLYGAEATHTWLSQQRLTVEDFEAYFEDELLIEKWKDHLFSEGGEARFESERERFDITELSQIIVSDEAVANELMSALSAGADFAELAREHSIAEDVRRTGGYLGTIGREELPPSIAETAFGAEEGTVIGPLETDAGIHLVKIHGIQKAELDAETRSVIRETLFREWLQEQRTAVEVTQLL